MEFLSGLFTIFLIIAGFLLYVYGCFVFPIKVHTSNKEKYGISTISALWAVIQAFFILALFFEIADFTFSNFIVILLGLIIVFGISLYRSVSKCIQANVPQNKIIITCVAQCCLSLGIVIAIILLILAIDDEKRKNKRNWHIHMFDWRL